MSITFGGEHLTIQVSTKAQMNSSITIAGSGTKLPITIIGEFKDIPPHLHQMYIQAMWSSYGNTNVNDKEEPYPMTIEEKQSEWRWNRIINIIGKAITKK